MHTILSSMTSQGVAYTAHAPLRAVLKGENSHCNMLCTGTESSALCTLHTHMQCPVQTVMADSRLLNAALIHRALHCGPALR